MVTFRWKGPVRAAAALLAVLVMLFVGGAQSTKVFTTRASVSSQLVPGNGGSFSPSLSANGRYIAFHSLAYNLVPGDTNLAADVFFRDLQRNTTSRISVASDGTQGNDASRYPSISEDGRFVSFSSFASNFVADDTNLEWDVFVRDMQTGTTERVSVDSNGVQGNDGSHESSISADGRYVAFVSYATNLIPGGTQHAQIFMRDRLNGVTTLVSRASDGSLPNDESARPSLSEDGRFVAFTSLASNLVTADTNGKYDVFVRDTIAGTTECVSMSSNGQLGNGDSYDGHMSGDGRFVAFYSFSNNLVPGDTNDHADVFVRDLQTGTTTLVSVAANSNTAADCYAPRINRDGRYIAFQSPASNLILGDTNSKFDVFVRDMKFGITTRASLTMKGLEADGDSTVPCLSSDGKYVAFQSVATNLVAGPNSGEHIYVRGPARFLRTGP